MAVDCSGHQHIKYDITGLSPETLLEICLSSLFVAVFSFSMSSASSSEWVLTSSVWWKESFCMWWFLILCYHVCHHSSKIMNLKLCVGVGVIEKYAGQWRPQINYGLSLLLFYLSFLFAWPLLFLCLSITCILFFSSCRLSPQVSLLLLPSLREVWRQEASRNSHSSIHIPFTFTP